jgi:CRP-like cAMP-binding protein
MLTDTGLELSRPETFGIPRALRPAAETPRALGKVRRDVRNELLGALDEHDVATILPRLERLHLKPRQVLLERNLPAAHAYFIESGAASMLSRVGDRSWVEVATLGRQDFVGLPIMLGTGRSPHRCVVQVAGEALRIGADELLKAMDELPALRQILLAYVQSRMVQGAQLVACNTRHSLAERLARWLLSAHDRLEGDVIPLTHQCLGRSLGVRRAGITTAVGRMEKAGLIRRGRGQLLIVDREGLERTSCECYRAIRAECQRALALR